MLIEMLASMCSSDFKDVLDRSRSPAMRHQETESQSRTEKSRDLFSFHMKKSRKYAHDTSSGEARGRVVACAARPGETPEGQGRASARVWRGEGGAPPPSLDPEFLDPVAQRPEAHA